ncbi:MAG: MFS transporter [Lachnospiraceae bacterium]|nr:MFS transporter [Lachnospiraceae bacterium]
MINKTNPYQKTLFTCFIGYMVQAIVNNFVPLLFLTFQSQYSIPLSQITLMVSINFALQLTVDLLAVGLVDKIGYRVCAIFAHVCAAAGFILLTILPECFADPFIGILISVSVYAVGGGLLEVLISPIVEACPTDNKEKAMSLLHSFYCWGHVAVVLLSTIFFSVFSIENWKIMALLWAIVPFVNAISFARVPIASLNASGEKALSFGTLAKQNIFWIFILLMFCAGSCEQAISQWASTFAEKGLGVTKTIGDLAGPMSFAILMGSSRAFYGKHGEKINLERFMIYSTLLCMASYLIAALVPHPVFGLIGCSLSGLSVGILWPGTFSLASASIKGGGTAMFALLALAGDLGCASGPGLVGLVSGLFGDDLKSGILSALLFPLILLLGLFLKRITPATSSFFHNNT